MLCHDNAYTLVFFKASLLPAGFEEVIDNAAPAAAEEVDPVDVYGSALAPVGTSAPG